MTEQAVLLSRQSAFPLLATPVVPLWSMLAVDGWMGILLSCLLGWWLLSLAILDIRHFLLPDALTLPLIPVGLAATLPIAIQRGATARHQLPFGTYLALAAWLVWLYGPVQLP